VRFAKSAVPLLVLLAGPATGLSAQEEPPREPIPADVETIDGIVRAFYEVVSGPAGERPDRARDEALHLPGALIRLSVRSADGTPHLVSMSLEGYHERYGGLRARPFYEWEVHREVVQFGNVAHVWSTYVASDRPNGPPLKRGISSIQLYSDDTRWWITGWTDESERPDTPLPSRFLPAGTP
jgi:hypothetical protein